MKRVEQILTKLAIIQFIFLVIAQSLLMFSHFSPYLTKMKEYEGVNKNYHTQIIESFHHENNWTDR
jgi:ABC-type uncharacterized transport system involved in gliding motility auxiliary subunit